MASRLKRFSVVRNGNVTIEGVIWSDGAATIRVNGGLPQSWTAAQVEARRHPTDGSATDVVMDDPDEAPVDPAPARPCDAVPPCEHDLALHRIRPDGARDCTVRPMHCYVADPATSLAQSDPPVQGGAS